MGRKAKPRAKTHKDVEIRYNDDGTVDEIIVMSGDRKAGGVCLLHLEQMDDGYYWIGLASADTEPNRYPVHIDMHSEKRITARVRI